MKHERFLIGAVMLIIGFVLGFMFGSVLTVTEVANKYRSEAESETVTVVESSESVVETESIIEITSDETETETETEMTTEATEPETETTIDQRYLDDPSLWWCDKNIEIRLIADGGKLSPSGQDWNIELEITNLTDEEWTLSSDYMVINGYSIEGGLYETLPPNAITKGTMWFNAKEFLDAAKKAEKTDARIRLMVVNSHEYSKSYAIELN